MQWCCQLVQSVAKSRAEFYFVQRSAQQKNCETTHVTLCNSPATCLATALRDKLLRKLHSVTGPLRIITIKIVCNSRYSNVIYFLLCNLKKLKTRNNPGKEQHTQDTGLKNKVRRKVDHQIIPFFTSRYAIQCEKFVGGH